MEKRSSHYDPFSVRKVGEYRNVPVVETKRTYRDHDSQVASEILARDGELQDLELLARLYTEHRDDGSDTPVFKPGEIQKLDGIVGMPVFIEHSYPQGVKLPRPGQLNKDAYDWPLPGSVPIGRIASSYPSAAPGELWVKIRLDISGLTEAEVARLRAWLRNVLLEISIAYNVKDEPYLLADSQGKKYYGAIVQRADGKYARCVEASLTHRGDIAGCNVVMVKASADNCAEQVLYGGSENSGGDAGCQIFAPTNAAADFAPCSQQFRAPEEQLRSRDLTSQNMDSSNAGAGAAQSQPAAAEGQMGAPTGGISGGQQQQQQAPAADASAADLAPQQHQQQQSTGSAPGGTSNSAAAAAMMAQMAVGGNPESRASTQLVSEGQLLAQQAGFRPAQAQQQQQPQQSAASMQRLDGSIPTSKQNAGIPAPTGGSGPNNSAQDDKDSALRSEVAALRAMMAEMQQERKLAAVVPHVPHVAKMLDMSPEVATDFLLKLDQSHRDSVVRSALAAAKSSASGFGQPAVDTRAPPQQQQQQVGAQQQARPGAAPQQQARPAQVADLSKQNFELMRQAMAGKRTLDERMAGNGGADDGFARPAGKALRQGAEDVTAHRQLTSGNEPIGARMSIAQQQQQAGMRTAPGEASVMETMVVPGASDASEINQLQRNLERTAVKNPNSMFSDPGARFALGVLNPAF